MESQSGTHNILDQPNYPLVHEIFLSLEELSTGCTKKFKIAAKVFNDDGSVLERSEEKIVKMEVSAGTRDGMRVVVPNVVKKQLGGSGGISPGDMIFVIRQREHPFFTRSGDDLTYQVNISLKQALTGCSIEISLPCGESLSLDAHGVVAHGACYRVPRKGMTRGHGAGDRGDLFVKFSVVFPVNLTDEQKRSIKSILSD